MDETKREREKHDYPKIEASHIKAAVRGLWRMGAKTDEIAEILELTTEEVKKIIKNYSNGKNYRN